MFKQVMNVHVLAEYIAKTFGVSKVIVQNNNSFLTIEPMSADISDSANPKSSVDEAQPGTLSLDDFTEMQLCTKGYKFNRDDAY
ncbi:MAG: hypothetical protein LBS33_08955 [Streptococcaceae bacterium]|jgi:hypothetical protein|nr:hypothetical protein [Streptococcaceae bacterium]